MILQGVACGLGFLVGGRHLAGVVWSMLFLDVSVLDWLEDGRWCLLSLVCVGVGFKCRFLFVVFSP